MALREIGWDERKALAAKGHALPSGHYPMPDCDHVRAALRLYPKADPSVKSKLAELIRQRDHDLGCHLELQEITEDYG